jgi:SAM-dependent MidA family methyltransferase
LPLPESRGLFGAHFMIQTSDTQATPPGPGALPPDWLVAELADAGGWLCWRRVMELALYRPGSGYYSGSPRTLGRGGDFYTSVSVGGLFGGLLREFAVGEWRRQGEPAEFVLAEQGAHDGSLMRDLLAAGIPGLDAPEAFHRALRVCIVEPQPGYREAQRATLQGLGHAPAWLDSIDLLPASPGLLVCNELLDALPVHLLRWDGVRWRELGVSLDATGSSTWEPRAITDPRLEAEAARFPADLPEGHLAEVGLDALDWLRALGASPFQGTVCLLDYGLEEAEFFAPERAEGTLRRYRDHRMDGDILRDLGECDLTCHVNFTRLIEEAKRAGFETAAHSRQGAWLTQVAEEWLRRLEQPGAAALWTPALMRQFQTLTHPGLMGASFRALVLRRRGAPGEGPPGV